MVTAIATTGSVEKTISARWNPGGLMKSPGAPRCSSVRVGQLSWKSSLWQRFRDLMDVQATGCCLKNRLEAIATRAVAASRRLLASIARLKTRPQLVA